jgi:hypothetical protein
MTQKRYANALRFPPYTLRNAPLLSGPSASTNATPNPELSRGVPMRTLHQRGSTSAKPLTQVSSKTL